MTKSEGMLAILRLMGYNCIFFEHLYIGNDVILGKITTFASERKLVRSQGVLFLAAKAEL